MASRKTSPPKPSKVAVKPRQPKEIVKDLRTGIEDLKAIDPEHPWVRLLNEAVAAIRDDHLNFVATIKCVQEGLTIALMEVTREHREGLVQARGELEQIRTHLARFIDAGIRERGRDERIEEQLAGINARLKERSRDGRVVRHGKTTTAEELIRELEAVERAKGEELATLRDEIKRLRSELEAARATLAVLEGMAVDPLDRRPMPPPRRSWRTTAAEAVIAAPLD
jgi:chromosome segregation ATPase